MGDQGIAAVVTMGFMFIPLSIGFLTGLIFVLVEAKSKFASFCAFILLSVFLVPLATGFASLFVGAVSGSWAIFLVPLVGIGVGLATLRLCAKIAIGNGDDSPAVASGASSAPPPAARVDSPAPRTDPSAP